ncbi:hypothetical protein HNP93_000177 [Methanococcus maripaludis]|uniref:Uncharacterized protein n=1 Tax=Methanococcus maripaludis TaxID=39152 RepID=A0A2L1CCQ3_METMI|nr:hypothetical protein [Methanococcus maripaludis]AVB76666.1 hypothetical protein MMJJ_12860 [Methanococcus maripaludis]MBA2857476.1 hypothetical protein [Methanococcus maripaludis]MBA2863176.1 hypothetical protein [Methanococcus maripaludis]MBB6496820.1 hypothetical protein [Methanococcus maripaludis]
MRFTVNDSLITSVALFIIAFLLQGIPAILLPELVNNPVINQMILIMANTLRFLGLLFAIMSIVFWKKGMVIRY